jgi:GGDEF domain-containing protein
LVLLRRVQDPKTLPRLLSFAEAAEPDGYLIVMHLDLDGFGKINKDPTAGEHVADAVLKEFGKRLRETFDDIGVATRTFSGDEFSAFFRTMEPFALFGRIEKFRRRMASEPMAAIGRPNACSIGLAVYHPAPVARFSSADAILAHARTAEQKAKADGKNCIRISVGTPAGKPAWDDLRLALAESALRCRLDLHREIPTRLSTPYAHFAATELAVRFNSLALDDCDREVRDVKQIFGLQVGPVSRSEEDGRLSDWISIPDWAGLVAWALLRSTFASGFPLSPDDHLCFAIKPIDEKQSVLNLQIVRGGKASTIAISSLGPEPAAEIPIGNPWYGHTHACSGLRRWVPDDPTMTSPSALLPALLLLIGEDGTSIAGSASELAAAVITVDDRPVKGGGLPDFWQSNLTRVIWACLVNPNIQEIIVLGEVATAAQTVDWLHATPEKWSEAIYELQRMLAIPGHYLTSFKARNLVVTVVNDRTGLMEALSKASLLPAPLSVTSAIDLKAELGRERRIAPPPPDEKDRLLVTDGLRSRTLADAYPRALQILRSQIEDAQTEKPGRRFTEIQSFKLVLTDPLRDMVPEYWRPSEKGLRDYYQRNFKDPEGLFQRQLATSHGESNETEFNHALRACIDSLRLGRPTRRVTLPLGAYPTGHRDPIGWFSIQIFPRLRDGRWHLDFNWIWRTVEVLVGFPFSVYGSIEWSREFCEVVNHEVGKNDKPVEFGQLIYTALSFHMYLDDGELAIARAIVNDATG